MLLKFVQDLNPRQMSVSVLDIGIVWLVTYKVLKQMGDMKSIQLLKGVLAILGLFVISEIFNLSTLSWLLKHALSTTTIAVIFQLEIRRSILKLGIYMFDNTLKAKMDSKILVAFDKAITYMAEKKIGALITIEKEVALDDIINTGVIMNSDVSGELLINIFTPNTPLHDGAVIIKHGKVAAASAYLPLSNNEYIPKKFGTRHRAALGVSEITDSVTIVVSEETGKVSFTVKNQLIHDVSREGYMKMLREMLIEDLDQNDGKARIKDLCFMVISLVFSLMCLK